jgi:FlaA1/EpsC-like NDP-sugar epimerase
MALVGVSAPILAWSRSFKRLIMVAVDMALCVLTVWVAYYLRLGDWISLTGRPSLAVLLSIVLALPVFAAFGLYRTAFRHVEAQLFRLAATASVVYAILYAAVISAYAFDHIPRTLGFIQPLLLFLAISLSRIGASWLLTKRINLFMDKSTQRRVLIYGAGSSGRQLGRAALEGGEIRVLGFVDDDRSLQGSVISGHRVYGPDQLPELVDRYQIDDVLLALPSVPRRRRNEIIDGLRELSVAVRTLPGLMDLAHGRVQTSDLRELTIEDLLGRDPVPVHYNSLRERIEGHTILITGAGGSIGSELCRQIVEAQPARLLLVESSEYALYSIHRELDKSCQIELLPLLASVTNRERMDAIIGAWQPAMVFHAAAYKHVPLVEHNLIEGVHNNVFGTATVADLSIRHRVRDFVLVSTDKAVRPTNVMGASKRLAELYLQAMAAEAPHTCLSMVRFGNVLGSSGSVVPLFREQIRSGGPITITHREITRYFMTISEAVQLVVHASTMARGGEVFVLDMGDPVKIYDLARNLIHLSGLTARDETHPHGDIEIVTLGLRPGEKLYEELLIGGNPLPTEHPRIMMAKEPFMSLASLRHELNELEHRIAMNDAVGTRSVLCRLVSGYVPDAEIADFVYAAATAQIREPLCARDRSAA